MAALRIARPRARATQAYLMARSSSPYWLRIATAAASLTAHEDISREVPVGKQMWSVQHRKGGHKNLDGASRIARRVELAGWVLAWEWGLLAPLRETDSSCASVIGSKRSSFLLGRIRILASSRLRPGFLNIADLANQVVLGAVKLR